MHWKMTEAGYISEDGYLIEGQEHTEIKMRLFKPGDMQQPLARGGNLTHLQLIAAGHRMATLLLDKQTRYSVAVDEAAANFLAMIPENED